MTTALPDFSRQPLKDTNLECLKKSPQEPGNFQNMFQIKPKTQVIFVMVFFTLLVVSVVLPCCPLGSNERILFYYPGRQDGEQSSEYAIRAFPHTLANLCFMGMRLDLDSGFPQKLLFRYEDGFWVFLGVAETIVGQLLCCGVGIVQCLFNLLYYVIGVRNTKKPPGFFEITRFLPELSGNFKIFLFTVIHREIIILSPSLPLFFFLSFFFVCIIY